MLRVKVSHERQSDKVGIGIGEYYYYGGDVAQMAKRPSAGAPLMTAPSIRQTFRSGPPDRDDRLR